MSAELIVFICWMVVIIILGAKPSVKAFNREFVGLLMTGAFLFYSLTTPELFTVVMLAYIGARTYQKKLENGHRHISMNKPEKIADPGFTSETGH